METAIQKTPLKDLIARYVQEIAWSFEHDPNSWERSEFRDTLFLKRVDTTILYRIAATSKDFPTEVRLLSVSEKTVQIPLTPGQEERLEDEIALYLHFLKETYKTEIEATIAHLVTSAIKSFNKSLL